MFGFISLFLINLIMVEVTHIRELPSIPAYMFNLWKFIDLSMLIMSFIFMVFNFLYRHEMNSATLTQQRLFAAVTVLPIFLKLLDWLRLFSDYAFYISLMLSTIVGIKAFIIILVIWYIMFGTTFYLIDLNNNDAPNTAPDDESEILYKEYTFWLFDAFEAMYQTSIGEFAVDTYANSAYSRMLFSFFIISTFLISIVFLNMLIAIMADTFDFAMENRAKNSRLTELQKMADCVNIINRDQARMFKKISAIKFDDEDSDDDDLPGVSMRQDDKSEEDDDDQAFLLYAVTVDNEMMFSDTAAWDGTVNIIKKFTEAKINQSHDSLLSNSMKIMEQSIEQELKQTMSERETKL